MSLQIPAMAEPREQTLFSTTFFDFQAGYEKHVLVSKWIGLYFLVTLLLSSLIGGWWRYLSVQRQHVLDQEFQNYGHESPDISAKSNSIGLANKAKTF
jgi:hypothetical protein